MFRSQVYPTSQSYKQYHDASSEEASIHGEDESFLEKPTLSKPRQRGFLSCIGKCCIIFSPAVISCFISAFTAGLVVLLLLVSTKGLPISDAILHSKGAKPAGQLQHYHCGSTPSEAHALGCVFDIMSFAWTPPACYDGEVSAQVMATTGPWIFYLDHNATQPIPDSMDALSNEAIVWTEHSYHVAHCLYAWERIHRSYLTHRLLPSEIGSINHTMHCVGLLNADGAPKKTVNAIAYLVFDSCTDLN